MDIAILFVKGVLIAAGLLFCKKSIFNLFGEKKLFTREDIEVELIFLILGFILLLVGIYG